jgi:hypothetical protein
MDPSALVGDGVAEGDGASESEPYGEQTGTGQVDVLGADGNMMSWQQRQQQQARRPRARQRRGRPARSLGARQMRRLICPQRAGV